jgi:hypothetical protein
MKKLICSLAALAVLVSCEDDKPNIPTPVKPGNNKVWVLNEGNFQAGNSTLGVYDVDSNSYATDIFSVVNNRPLGDVLQSALQVENEIYLIVNNSGKIEVINKDNFESTGTISGLKSPRYALQVSPTEILVSDLFSDSVAVINPATKMVESHINISSSSEEMAMVNGKIFITNTYTSHITVIDWATKNVSTIATTFNPTAIGIDKNGKAWVLCGGDPFNSVNGAIEVINTNTESVEKTIALNQGSYTNKIAFNTNKDSLYYLTGGVYKMSIDGTSEPATPTISAGSNSFYGLSYNAEAEQVWLADAKDFNQKGQVLLFSRNGELVHSFDAGINPNGFLMEK